MEWKDQKMVLAGKKAQITKLKNEGKHEEARRLEETLAGSITTQIVEAQKQTLKPICETVYDVPFIRVQAEESLPWIEKYRPVTLADLIGQVAPYLRAFIKTNSFPLAMIFYGPYGNGKTAGARAFVRDYYVNRAIFRPEALFMDIVRGRMWTPEYERCWSPVLNIDATLDSDVDVIRSKVLSFMKARAIWNDVGAKLKKFVVFDEADRLGYASQGALRSLLEQFPGTVTIYTTNRIESIDPAIVSRASGGVFEFSKPDKDSLTAYLKKVLKMEHARLSDNVVEEIVVSSSSMREAVGKLQQEIAIQRG